MGTSLVSDGKVILRKGEGRTIKAGGAWVFDNEIDQYAGDYANGDIAVSYTHLTLPTT